MTVPSQVWLFTLSHSASELKKFMFDERLDKSILINLDENNK